MLKRIKFNLLLGNKYCKNLEDVKNNFNIHDILDYFDKGILEKWLTAQNLNDVNEKVSAIDKKADIYKKVNSLMEIFYEDEDENTIKEMSKEATYMIEFENKRKDDLEVFSKNNFKEKEVIDNYFKNYEDIVNLIIEKKEDYEFIKSSVKNISDNFMNAFKYNYFNLFEKLLSNECIFGMLSIFANEFTREYFLNSEIIMKGTLEIFNHGNNIYSEDNIKNNTSSSTISSMIVYSAKPIIDNTKSKKKSKFAILNNKLEDGSYLLKKIKIYSQNTKKHFSTVIEDKKCLILHIDSGCNVTSFKDKSKEYSYTDINNKFLILDGITYMGASESAQLVYMEI